MTLATPFPPDVDTLDDFRRNAEAHLDRLRRTGRPSVLTVDGRPAVVVQDAAAYDEQAARLERYEVVEAVKLAAEQADRGEGVDAREFLQRMRDDLRARHPGVFGGK